ncbi:MAG TPA: glycine betaine ABC transporter substrate-binding protein [Chthonomonadaceae bacterium]|nr:glycine betaine ABC transporter substrate-binding protein [Chthonomonadaceae bacterium]
MKALLVLFFLVFSSVQSVAAPIVVGSKKFTESYVLGEIARGLLEKAHFTVTHKQGMGGTAILWNALKSGAITLYPEYTGTIGEEILKVKGNMSPGDMQAALARYGVGMTGDLGFNDTYALVMRADRAKALGIAKISDLRSHPDLVVAVTHEFLGRQDGWRPLTARYGLHMRNVRGIDHTLAYVALANGSIDITDAYSTDARIAEDKLTVLQDDLGFFPQYKAVFLYRLNAPPLAVAAVRTLEGNIDEPLMIRLNAAAERSKDYTQAAALYFREKGQPIAMPRSTPPLSRIGAWTLQHLELVAISLVAAILIGVPLGIVASRPGPLSQIILGITGVIQTIPSLALLALLVPIKFLGISPATAVVALFLYSLLPIVRNTATGLQEIPQPLRESAAALGLPPFERLTRIFLPMASRTILAGIKTSAIINVGTATLAALIGAGGLGEPIISGLNLNDNNTILEGAVPAALLALVVQFLFDLLDRLLIPRGLRLQATK